MEIALTEQITNLPPTMDASNEGAEPSDGDNDIQNLYKYVNGIRVNVLKNTELINTMLIKLETSINRLNKFEEESSISLARLSADMIITQDDLKKLTTKVDKHPEIPRIHEKINNNKNEITKLNSNEQINAIKNDLESLSSKIKNGSKQISTQTHQDTALHYSSNKKSKREIDYSKCLFTSDYIFITDSNLTKMDPSIINHGSNCSKFFCPTLSHIGDLFTNITIIKQPKVIFIHCGTNDIELDGFTQDKFEDMYVNLLDKIRICCPTSKIIISSLLPREEVFFKQVVSNINDFLRGCCTVDTSLQFMFSNNIYRHMLMDKKHLNREGFSVLLSNIRFTIFNKTPNFRRRVTSNT